MNAQAENLRQMMAQFKVAGANELAFGSARHTSTSSKGAHMPTKTPKPKRVVAALQYSEDDFEAFPGAN